MYSIQMNETVQLPEAKQKQWFMSSGTSTSDKYSPFLTFPVSLL